MTITSFIDSLLLPGLSHHDLADEPRRCAGETVWAGGFVDGGHTLCSHVGLASGVKALPWFRRLQG